MKAGIHTGMEYHYLGATLLTLMFGWQLAVLGVMIEVGVLVIRDIIEWQVFAANVFLMGIIPITIAAAVYIASMVMVASSTYTYAFVTYEYTPISS